GRGQFGAALRRPDDQLARGRAADERQDVGDQGARLVRSEARLERLRAGQDLCRHREALRRDAALHQRLPRPVDQDEEGGGEVGAGCRDFTFPASLSPPHPNPLRPNGAEREGPIAQQWEGEVGRWLQFCRCVLRLLAALALRMRETRNGLYRRPPRTFLILSLSKDAP